jgi:hypothetical protein
MYCNQEIIMSEETGKWLPYNKDGSSHDCRTAATATATATATNGQKQQQETPITVHQLKIWLARLEIAEVHIDKRLRVSAIINFIIIALS